MWLSGKIEKPGFVKIAYIQRGFPIKEVFPERKRQVNQLRKDLKKRVLNPSLVKIFFLKYLLSL